MAKPDTRKRDRAAYFRDYRAKKAKERPTIESLAMRVSHLETLIAAIVEVQLSADGLANVVASAPFGAPKPAPKSAHPAATRK